MTTFAKILSGSFIGCWSFIATVIIINVKKIIAVINFSLALKSRQPLGFLPSALICLNHLPKRLCRWLCWIADYFCYFRRGRKQIFCDLIDLLNYEVIIILPLDTLNCYQRCSNGFSLSLWNIRTSGLSGWAGLFSLSTFWYYYPRCYSYWSEGIFSL